jgi:RHS repeat-associated protein
MFANTYAFGQSADSSAVPFSSLDTITARGQLELDSVRNAAATQFASIKTSYDSVFAVAGKQTATLNAKIDSLEKLNLPVAWLSTKIDSIRQWKDERINALNDKVEKLKSGVSEKGAFIAGGGNSGDPNSPKGWLNMLIFDKDFNLVDLAYEQLDEAYVQPVGNVNKLPMQLLSLSRPIKEPGYVYIYLSNEGSVQQDIYFDDLTITHQKSKVVQGDDYYPFGLTFNSYSRENSTPQDYKYNGKEEQTELDLGWLDYGARMYQPELGRFFTQDRFAEKYLDFTPYHYGANNPILYIDVNGDSLDLSNLSEEQRAAYDAQIEKLSQNKLFKEYYSALQSSETMYTFKAGAGKGGTGSFGPSTNEVSANLESTYGIAQELFHAFQSDLGVYTSADNSVRETEGDIVSGAIALSVGEPAMSEDWDQGIKFNYTDDNLVFDKKVLTKEFDNDFNKAVDGRIDFYKKREIQDGAKAPATYVQKNSGVGALALKALVKRLYPNR